MKTKAISVLEMEDFKVGYTMDILNLGNMEIDKVCIYAVDEVNDIIYFYNTKDPEDTGCFSISDLSDRGVFGEHIERQIVYLYDEEGWTIWS